MSRGYSKVKRNQLSPDSVHVSTLVSKFINYIMERGKKSVAEKIVYSSMEKLAKESRLAPLDALDRVIKNVGPLLEIKAKRIGGANYQVPIEVNSARKETLALRWIIESAKKRKGAPMADKLASEMLDAYNGVGASIKKKEDTHRMAEANKAFAHFARL